MCLFCATKKAAVSAYQRYREQRRRDRIFKNMQRSASPVRHTPAISTGIETYNIFGVGHEKR